MASTIKLKNGSGAPTTGDLVQGEPALDLTNKRLYTENASGVVIEVGTNPSTIDINAGTIDGTVIGGTTPAAITGTTITGTSFVSSGDMTFGDNDKAIFGAGSDLQIYHDGSNSYIKDVGTGFLVVNTGTTGFLLQNGSGQNVIQTGGNDVTLRYGASTKLTTTTTGIDVTGTVTADGLTVAGNANITGNTTLGDASTDTVQVNGRVGIGSAGLSFLGLFVSSSAILGGQSTAVASLRAGGTLGSDVTVDGSGLIAKINTEADSFTLTTARGVFVDDALKGAGSAITNLHGIQVSDQTQGTNNYGITSLVSSGTNKWNIYASGTAANYFAGSLGIGTSSPFSELSIKSASPQIYLETISNGNVQINFNENADQLDVMVNNSLGKIAFGTNSNERMRIDSSGNVGIGTSSPSDLLDISANGTSAMRLSDSSSPATYAQITQANGVLTFAADAGNAQTGSNMQFEVDGSERMRIDSSGNLLVGTTGLAANGTRMSVSGADRVVRILGSTEGQGALVVDKTTNTSTTSQVFIQFTINNQVTANGQINANGASQAAFGSFSDARLKQNIVDLDSQWENIKALRPVEFDYIESEGGGHQIGFIAQEVEPVYPDLVGEREDGMFTLSGMGKNESRLIKALQEAITRIETLEAEVAALKGAN